MFIGHLNVFVRHLFKSFVCFKNWVTCVDFSLQENGGYMKTLELGNDHLREKMDIGPGTKSAFWGASGDKGEGSCPL